MWFPLYNENLRIKYNYYYVENHMSQNVLRVYFELIKCLKKAAFHLNFSAGGNKFCVLGSPI